MNAKELASAIAVELGLPDSASNDDILAGVKNAFAVPVSHVSGSVNEWEQRVSNKVGESIGALTREGAAAVLRQQDAEKSKSAKSATTA